MKISIFKWLIFILLISQFAISQTYIVKAKTLNVREETTKNSTVIGKLNENDTIKSISNEGDWIKIMVSEKEGFVNKNYLEEIKLTDEITKGGFKNGFKKVFGTAFIIILLILLGYRKMKGKVSDGRYSKGYKEYEISTKDYIIDGVYALIISSFVALIFGIIAWIKTF